jgi:ribosomal protein S18 acetylase RimI-like enzyme
MITAHLAATPEDFAAAARLQADFDAEYDYPDVDPDRLAPHLAKLTSRGDTAVWLVSVDGHPALGHGIVRFRTQSLVDELEAYIAELYVVPDRRGQGLGSVLLQALLDDARARGATYVDLNTGEDDASARAIYEKFGFDCHEGRGSGPMAIYYEKDL